MGDDEDFKLGDCLMNIDFARIKDFLARIYKKYPDTVDYPVLIFDAESQKSSDLVKYMLDTIKYCNNNKFNPFENKKLILILAGGGSAAEGCTFEITVIDNDKIISAGPSFRGDVIVGWDKLVYDQVTNEDVKMHLKVESILQKHLPNYCTMYSQKFIESMPYAWKINHSDLSNKLSLTDAFTHLKKAVSILYPSGYKLGIKISEGFGDKPIKRKTVGKIFHFITSINRIYSNSGSGHSVEEKQPHYRRPHIRHLWKSSGVNRFELPDNPFERLKIVQEKQVRRTWVSESFPGFEEKNIAKGMKLVLGEDIEL